jgi:hypothetical protein
MDTKVVGFESSAIKFLRENNFDFNKLFSQAINYERLSDMPKIQKRVDQQFGDVP